MYTNYLRSHCQLLDSVSASSLSASSIPFLRISWLSSSDSYSCLFISGWVLFAFLVYSFRLRIQFLRRIAICPHHQKTSFLSVSFISFGKVLSHMYVTYVYLAYFNFDFIVTALGNERTEGRMMYLQEFSEIYGEHTCSAVIVWHSIFQLPKMLYSVCISTISSCRIYKINMCQQVSRQYLCVLNVTVFDSCEISIFQHYRTISKLFINQSRRIILYFFGILYINIFSVSLRNRYMCVLLYVYVNFKILLCFHMISNMNIKWLHLN